MKRDFKYCSVITVGWHSAPVPSSLIPWYSFWYDINNTVVKIYSQNLFKCTSCIYLGVQEILLPPEKGIECFDSL